MAPYTLYTWGTPNGWKASITIEELGLEYDVKPVNIGTNEQKEDWYLKINPNGRIPALVDHEEGDFPVFESGAIMWYLADKDPAGKLFPKDRKKQAEVMSWLMFQMGGVGPMQGQANHFLRFAPEKILYGIERYTKETDRLYDVLEEHLKKHEYLANDEYSLADIANWSWVAVGAFGGSDIGTRPALKAWVDRIAARPAVKKGINVPTEAKFAAFIYDEAARKKVLEEATEIRSKAAEKKD